MKQFVVVAVFVMPMLAGCSGDSTDASLTNTSESMEQSVEVDIVGQYKLDKAALRAVIMSQRPAETPAVGPAADASIEMVDQMLEGMNGSIYLEADSTCRMSMAMMGKKKVLVGSWKLQGERLAITASEEGREQETRLATFANGLITIEQESNGQPMPMTFKRAAK